MDIEGYKSFENEMFTMSEGTELTSEVLKGFIERHQKRLVRYNDLRNQYRTRPPILYEDGREEGKPDHRIPVNFGKYIVDTFNGFFSGIPVRVTHRDEEVGNFIKDFWKSNDMDNVINETAKITSIYGHGYWYIYQNEDAETEIAYNDPLDMFIIYTDEIRPRALYGVRYTTIGSEEDNEDGSLYRGELYSKDTAYNFRLAEDKLSKSEQDLGEGNPDGQLFYGRVPIIEVIENEERMSLIEPVEFLMNEYNKAISEKANDISYFADAYLSIIGAYVPEESLNEMRKTRTINIFEPFEEDEDGNKVMEGEPRSLKDVVVEFLEKPNADQTQEHFLDRVERLIYNTSMVVNLNDDKLGRGSESSGSALMQKEQPMSHLALNKERKYTQALNTLFQMLFNIITNVSPQANADKEYRNIEYRWTRNLPSNKVTEADVVQKLDGIISRRKQLEMLSSVLDVDEEMERIREEYELLETLKEELESGESDNELG